ncbi:unnamed protein product [Nyctereutes procyonoides]|uniref:40S ribosomal protein S15 n=1 Tax=Nyctereutes procyonoides TaxID=34880 RepID=A0A811ZJE4_NYCPR|nr:unnamed protein product [Nyctereutes procyonoides]
MFSSVRLKIRPELISHPSGESSVPYKPVKHSGPGIGATHSSHFIPLKWPVQPIKLQTSLKKKKKKKKKNKKQKQKQNPKKHFIDKKC